MLPALRQIVYRKDGTARISASANATVGGANKGPFDILTFGRTGLKGPTGRKRLGLDMTTVETGATTVVDVDTRRYGSGAGLVSEGRSSRDTETTMEV